MSEWSTDFTKLPETGRVIVQGPEPMTDACLVTEDVRIMREFGGYHWIAWHPAPEPYVPPKPEQITPRGLGVFLGIDEKLEVIAAIEKRTREIIAWENKYE